MTMAESSENQDDKKQKDKIINYISAAIGAVVGTIISGGFSYLAILEANRSQVELEKMKINDKRGEMIFSSAANLFELNEKIMELELKKADRVLIQEVRDRHQRSGNEIILLIGEGSMKKMSSFSNAFEDYIGKSLAGEDTVDDLIYFIEIKSETMKYITSYITKSTG